MPPQIIADESVDNRIIIQLRQIEFSVYSIAEESPSIKDNEVLAIAVQHNALLITEDKDFGELVFRLKLPHKGIVLLRMSKNGFNPGLVSETIKKYYEDLFDKFSVFEDTKIRIRF